MYTEYTYPHIYVLGRILQLAGDTLRSTDHLLQSPSLRDWLQKAQNLVLLEHSCVLLSAATFPRALCLLS